MNRLLVTGGNRLSGRVPIGGAKNSALKLMAAALLADGRTVLRGVPDILDVQTMTEVLERLGARTERVDHTLVIDTSDEVGFETGYDLVQRMRASIIVLGPLLARHGEARVAMPGGCNIGSRAINLHIRGLEKMGAVFAQEHGYLVGVAPELQGGLVDLDFPSVGATENVLMAAVGARGTTVIENAAREPEIQDLALFLLEMGARIDGVGTPTIEIEGTPGLLTPVEHTVIPDRIEAGTFAMAVCATEGDVLLVGARADHLDLVFSKLSDVGATIRTEEDGVRVVMEGRPRSADLVTLPYPGFPTDLQPPYIAVMARSEGTSIVTENVFESRFMFIGELKRMGADIRTHGHHAVIRGMDRLSGAPVRAHDLRAGAALILAALGAEGVTMISDVHHVDRGYEDVDGKLTGLGADVRRRPALAPARV
jgi:UDP-N-acetylglucosamine 1-carboxyvinyltransferase